jgi:hypothetical protein
LKGSPRSGAPLDAVADLMLDGLICGEIFYAGALPVRWNGLFTKQIGPMRRALVRFPGLRARP